MSAAPYFTLEINLEEDSTVADVVTSLTTLAEKLEFVSAGNLMPGVGGRVSDSEGRTVGFWRVNS